MAVLGVVVALIVAVAVVEVEAFSKTPFILLLARTRSMLVLVVRQVATLHKVVVATHR